MARMPNVKAEKAKELYASGMKLVEIAKALEVPEGTVRRWKHSYNWDQKGKSERSDKNKANVRNKNVPETIKIDNPNISEKRKLFCLYFIKYRNKVKAYQKAYECSYENARSHASDLWKSVEVRQEIERLLEEYRSGIELDIKDLFQWYLDIARADITDFVTFGRTKRVIGKTKDGKPITAAVNYVDLIESSSVDGTIISEVSQGKDGVKVKLNDRIKAMEWLDAHIGLADEKQRAEIALLRAKAQVDDEAEEKVDGFIAALNATAGSDWEDEEN